LERLADPTAWRDRAAFEQFRVAMALRAAELQRTTGRRDMPAFGRWLKQASPEWPWHYRHLKVIRKYLNRVEAGEIQRLMISLHPRSFKSQMVTVRYPAYVLERDPLTRIIVGSYNQELAESFSLETRRIVAERGVALNPKRQKVNEWLTAAGGGLKAVGVGSGVTGRGGNLILIDDPVQSYEQAHSRAYRERVWNWWRTDLFSRLEPHPRDGRPPAVILIMTRWAEDDLAGRILAGEDGEQWHVLRIPALAETQAERDDYNAGIGRPPGEADPLGRAPGEAMNPERFDVKQLEAIRVGGGLMSFMALYQQRPSAPEGDMFRREWFEVVSAEAFAALTAPGTSRAAVRYWDKAGSKSAGSAYTAGVLMARVGGDTYVAHLVMGKWTAPERERVIRQTAAADFAAWGYDVETVVEQEPGSGGKESADNTVDALSGMGYRVAADRPTGDKTLRAEPLAAAASVGRVKLVEGPWNRDYLDILAAFPGGAVKDAVDASSGAFIRLTQVERGRPAAGQATVTSASDIFDD
jgi:predicted phage terminase large subunit-like protein